MNVRGLTKRREAPAAVTVLMASGAALMLGELPLGAGFRGMGLMAVMLAAGRELSVRHRGIAATEVREDRRRVARDLHDGLAQELGFIASQSKHLVGAYDHQTVSYVGLAAQRALDESRTLIGALNRLGDEPLEQLIAREAREVAARAGAQLDLRVDPNIKLQPDTADAVLRIVREAVTNAVRHGRAGNVRVELLRDGGLSLRVADDGIGIASEPSAGFGLQSMRQRAERLGGSFRVLAQAGGGTSVEVLLP